jgi:hypothetical protein
MNRSRTLPFLAVLGMAVLTACGSPRSAPPAGSMITPLSLGPPPIYALLGYRQELALTSEQVAALDSIAQSAQEQNRPLISQLQAASRERARQPGFFEVTPEAQPILDEIRANQRGAADAVAELLTEDQRGTVCRVFDPTRRSPNARARQPARTVANDTVQARMMGGPTGWHWCNPTPTTAETVDPASRTAETPEPAV